MLSHSGIYGNEVADKIAKYGARETVHTTEPHIANKRANIRAFNDSWLAQQTHLSWRATQKCEHTKEFVQHINPAITEQLLIMSKSDIKITVGLITGHCKLNSHLAKLGIRDDPDCDLCGNNRETAKLVLCECTSLATIREQIFGRAAILPNEICNHPLQNVVTFYKNCSETNYHISRAF